MPTMVVSDDEDSDDDESQEDEPPPSNRRHPDLPDEVFESRKTQGSDDHPNAWKMSFDGLHTDSPHLIPEDEEVQAGTPQAELLAWHY